MVYVLHFAFFFHRQRPEAEVNDPVAVRKVQKADREKLRRDRLNDHFQELGSAIGKPSIYPFVHTSLIPCALHVLPPAIIFMVLDSLFLAQLVDFV